MRTRIRLAAAVLSVASTAIALMVLLAAPAAADESIDAGNVYFCDPSFENGICETTIQQGETVTWTMVAGFHTVSQCTGQTFAGCPAEGGFDSGQLMPGAQFQETFDTPGTFYYLCQNHPTQMMGILTVEAQETPTPSPTDAPAAPTATAAPSAAATGTPTPAAAPSTGGGSPGGSADGLVVLIVGALLVAATALVLRRSATRE